MRRAVIHGADNHDQWGEIHLNLSTDKNNNTKTEYFIFIGAWSAESSQNNVTFQVCAILW